jgi:hypothetical protein
MLPDTSAVSPAPKCTIRISRTRLVEVAIVRWLTISLYE